MALFTRWILSAETYWSAVSPTGRAPINESARCSSVQSWNSERSVESVRRRAPELPNELPRCVDLLDDRAGAVVNQSISVRQTLGEAHEGSEYRRIGHVLPDHRRGPGIHVEAVLDGSAVLRVVAVPVVEKENVAIGELARTVLK